MEGGPGYRGPRIPSRASSSCHLRAPSSEWLVGHQASRRLGKVMLMPGTKSVRNSNCVVKQVFRPRIWGLGGENHENWRSCSQRIWIKVWEGLKHPGD